MLASVNAGGTAVGLWRAASLGTRLRSRQQLVQQLQADVAKAEVQRDSAAAAKMKLPLFPMSPLAAPPVRHDASPAARLVEEDKENMDTAAAAPRGKSHVQVTPSDTPERAALIAS